MNHELRDNHPEWEINPKVTKSVQYNSANSMVCVSKAKHVGVYPDVMIVFDDRVEMWNFLARWKYDHPTRTQMVFEKYDTSYPLAILIRQHLENRK